LITAFATDTGLTIEDAAGNAARVQVKRRKVNISVAMATYNGAEYLAAQLDSLARQTHLPDELVISAHGKRDQMSAELGI
jgi:hypothetical protein